MTRVQLNVLRVILVPQMLTSVKLGRIPQVNGTFIVMPFDLSGRLPLGVLSSLNTVLCHHHQLLDIVQYHVLHVHLIRRAVYRVLSATVEHLPL